VEPLNKKEDITQDISEPTAWNDHVVPTEENFRVRGSNVSTNVAKDTTVETAGTPGSTITVAQGGTGATTLTGILKGNGTSAVTAVTPLAGTKVYYVADSSGGAVTRKLTFSNGVLTSEI